jgi:ferredoxin
MQTLCPFAKQGANLEKLLEGKKIRRKEWDVINAKCSWFNICKEACEFGWLTYESKATCFFTTKKLEEDLRVYLECSQLDEEEEPGPIQVCGRLLCF